MANIKISELTTNSSPSTSATLVGVDNGETVQIPASVFQNQIDYIHQRIREDLIEYDDAVINGGQTDPVNISSPQTVSIRNNGEVYDPNAIIMNPNTGISLISSEGVNINSNSISITNNADQETGLVIESRSTDLHSVRKLYAKDDEEGFDTMPAGCVLTSGNGDKIRWSSDYVHSDTLDDKLLNYADKDHTHDEYLTGDTVFDVDGVATEKYVDDEIASAVSGLATVAKSGNYNDLSNKPTIPSIAGLASTSYVDTKVAGIVNSAPEALNTLNELANALGNDANFATTVSTEIGKKVDTTTFQTFCGDLINGMDGDGNELKVGLAETADSADKLNTNAGSTTQPVYFANGVPVATTYTLGKSVPSDAKFTDTVYTHPSSHPATMITGLATVATSGSYNDLSNKPTIPAAVTVDSALSNTSANPVQNKVINSALGNKVDKVSGKGLSTNDLTATLKTNYDAAYTHSTSAHAPSNAEKNQNAFSNVTVGSTTIAADTTTDTLTLVAGNNITLTPDSANDKITIAASMYAHPLTHDASMITGLATVATSGNYNDLTNKPTIPTKTSQLTNDSGFKTTDNNTTYSISKSGSTITLTGSDGSTTSVSDSNTIYDPATTSVAGLMTAMDKTKLDGIANNANAYLHPTYTAKSSGLYKVTVDTQGHVSAATAVAKSDITALGIPAQDTTYTLGSFGITATAAELNYVDGVTSNIQTQLNGKAASSHGTHVSYGTAAPNANGTASAGSATTVSRSDHVHPLQTSVSGNAGTISVTNTTPTSATTYYPLYATGVSGAQTVRANADLYYYDSGTLSYFNIGSSSQKGGITLHETNGKYVNLATVSNLTANRDINLPDASGTVITTGNFPVASSTTLGGVKVNLNGTTLEISTI